MPETFVNPHLYLQRVRKFSTILDRYLRDHREPKLQLGAGKNVLDGWLNTDLDPADHRVEALDTTLRFPIVNDTFSLVYSEHHFEHLDFLDGERAAQEIYRILRPDGTFRIATPDLDVILALHNAAPLSTRQEEYVTFIECNFLPPEARHGAVSVINNAFRNWGHRYLYNLTSLGATLERSGFVDIQRKSYGESLINNLQNIERHHFSIGNRDIAEFETMILEARKPA